MSRSVRVTLITCVLVAVAGLLWTSGAQSLTPYNLTLSHAEVSTDPGGRLVVTMASRGDLPGMLTLGLRRDAAGAVTGEWALVVSYMTLTDHHGHVDVAPLEGQDHEESDHGALHRDALVQKGVLKGDVSGGSLSFNPDGSLGSLNVTLGLTGGTVEFGGVTTGNGAVGVDNLNDRAASMGIASVLF